MLIGNKMTLALKQILACALLNRPEFNAVRLHNSRFCVVTKFFCVVHMKS